MTAESATAGSGRPARWLDAPGRLAARVRRTPLWQNPPAVRALMLGVEAAAVGFLAWATTTEMSLTTTHAVRFGILFAMAALYAECGGRIERLRSFVCSDGVSFSTPTGLWCCAGTLILPVGMAGWFVVAVYAHAMLQLARHGSVTPYRFIYTMATAVVSGLAAAAFIRHLRVMPLGTAAIERTTLAVLGAIVIYTVINRFLLGLAVYITTHPTEFRSVLLTADDEATELAELMLGVLLAVTVLRAPYLAPAGLVPLAVLRRSALVRNLQTKATLDAKTGLLNASAWRQRAEKELEVRERFGTPVSVLMIDLDHFKLVNDEYGHPAGDAALRAVGNCLIDALRSRDTVGRFGGEEFVALLPGADAEVSARVAERLRARIAELELEHGGHITASIGVGTGLADRNRLDELIAVADKALYVSKAAGRDHVHVQVVDGPGSTTPLTNPPWTVPLVMSAPTAPPVRAEPSWGPMRADEAAARIPHGS